MLNTTDARGAAGSFSVPALLDKTTGSKLPVAPIATCRPTAPSRSRLCSVAHGYGRARSWMWFSLRRGDEGLAVFFQGFGLLLGGGELAF